MKKEDLKIDEYYYFIDEETYIPEKVKLISIDDDPFKFFIYIKVELNDKSIKSLTIDELYKNEIDAFNRGRKELNLKINQEKEYIQYLKYEIKDFQNQLEYYEKKLIELQKINKNYYNN